MLVTNFSPRWRPLKKSNKMVKLVAVTYIWSLSLACCPFRHSFFPQGNYGLTFLSEKKSQLSLLLLHLMLPDRKKLEEPNLSVNNFKKSQIDNKFYMLYIFTNNFGRIFNLTYQFVIHWKLVLIPPHSLVMITFL